MINSFEFYDGNKVSYADKVIRISENLKGIKTINRANICGIKLGVKQRFGFLKRNMNLPIHEWALIKNFKYCLIQPCDCSTLECVVINHKNMTTKELNNTFIITEEGNKIDMHTFMKQLVILGTTEKLDNTTITVDGCTFDGSIAFMNNSNIYFIETEKTEETFKYKPFLALLTLLGL